MDEFAKQPQAELENRAVYKKKRVISTFAPTCSKGHFVFLQTGGSPESNDRYLQRHRRINRVHQWCQQNYGCIYIFGAG